MHFKQFPTPLVAISDNFRPNVPQCLLRWWAELLQKFGCYHLQKDLDEIMCCTRQKKNAKRRKRRTKQHNSRSRIAGEDISAAEPSTTSTTTVIDSGV